MRYLVNSSFDALQDCSIIDYQSIDPTEFHREYHNETKDKSEVQVEIMGLDKNGIWNFLFVDDLQIVII